MSEIEDFIRVINKLDNICENDIIKAQKEKLLKQDKEIERLKQNIDYAIKLLEPIVAFGMDIAVKGKMLEPILDKLKEVNGSDKE